MADAMFTMNCHEQFKILNEHKTIEVLLAPMLEGMCNTLAMGIEEYLRSFDVSQGVQLLCDIGASHIPTCGDAATMCLRALSLIMEHVPQAAQTSLANPKVLQVVRDRLTTFQGLRYEAHSPQALVEDGLRIVKFLNEEDSRGVVAGSGIFTEIVNVMEALSVGSSTLRSQSKALEVLTQLCGKIRLSSQPLAAQPKPKKARGGGPAVAAPVPQDAQIPKLRKELNNVVVPALIRLLRQLLEGNNDITPEGSSPTTSSSGDKWPPVEATIRCLVTLLHRADMCARINHQGAPQAFSPDELVRMLTDPDLISLLFSALLGPVANTDARRESILATLIEIATVRPQAMWPVLPERRIVDWFLDVLQPAKRDVGSMLENPFPVRSARASGALQTSPSSSSGNHSALLVSGAAFFLQHVLPSIPTEQRCITFLVLPLHEWEWSDDLHAFSPYPDENSSQIELARFHGHRNASVKIRGTEYIIDFEAGLQYNASSRVGRPIHRKPNPKAYAFLDASNPPQQHGDLPLPVPAAAIRHTAPTVELATLVHVYGPIFMSLCATASHEIHRAMAACGMAKLLVATSTMPDFRKLVHPMMEDLGEYLASVLSTADDLLSIDSGIIAMNTLFQQAASKNRAKPDNTFSTGQFASLCRRFGIHEKLRALRPRLESKVVETSPAKKPPPKGKAEPEPSDIKARLSTHVEKILFHVQHLVEQCDIGKESEQPDHQNNAAALAAAVELFNKSSDSFKEAYLGSLLGTVAGSESLTVHEFGQVNVAKSLASFVLPVDPDTGRLDDLLSKKRVAVFAAELRKNSTAAHVLVRQLVGEVGIMAKKLPEAESLFPTGKTMKCRQWQDAVSRLAASSPNIHLCCYKPPKEAEEPAAPAETHSTEASEKSATPDRRQLCPEGHRLRPYTSVSWSCDLCMRPSNGDSSMCCRACDFDICPDCYMNPSVGYEGGEFESDDPNDVGDEDTGEHLVMHRGGPLAAQKLGGIRAHLAATIGDIERYYRRSQSANAEGDQRNMELMRELAREQLEAQGIPAQSGVADELMRQLMEAFGNRPRPPQASQAAAANRPNPLPAIPENAHRFELFYDGIGRVPMQQTVLGMFFDKAVAYDIQSALQSLEDCLMTEDLRVQGATPPRSMSSPAAAAANSPTRSKVFYLHVFRGPEEANCCCSEINRRDAENDASLLVDRQRQSQHAAPSEFLANPKTTLLWLLFNLCCTPGADGQGEFFSAADVEVTGQSKSLALLSKDAFLCHELAMRAVKAAAASALRVALLPPQFALPKWLTDVLESASFLISTEVRQALTTFIACGARRSLWRAIQQQGCDVSGCQVLSSEWARSFGNRPTQKEIIRRGVSLISDANKSLFLAAEQRNPMHFEFEGDKGTGLGPTVQFFTSVAQTLGEKSRQLWRVSNIGGGSQEQEAAPFVTAPSEGLFPCPQMVQFVNSENQETRPKCTPLPSSALNDFYVCGAATARAVVDGRVFPLPISAAVFQILRSRALVTRRRSVSIGDVALIDQGISATLRMLSNYIQKINRASSGEQVMDDKGNVKTVEELSAEIQGMCLTFVVPGADDIELVPGGKEKEVTAANLSEFCKLLAFIFGHVSVKSAIDAFAKGFCDVAPLYSCVPLSATEFTSLVGGIGPNSNVPLWTREELERSVTGNHGYSHDSPEVRILIDVLVEFSPQEQSQFLNFCTGCPRLPVGGMAALGTITVVRKDPTTSSVSSTGSEQPRNIGLPSVNTCFKYLKLPPYSSAQEMRDCLLKAINGSGDAFDLT